MFLIAVAFSTERQAHAYANPGSSLVLFQGASSLVMGAFYFFRANLRTWFRRLTGKGPDTQEQQ